MGYSKDQLLARLQELQIDFTQYDHPIVLTVEAQAKYVGNVKGALCKNLFLKDKKHRFYIVSALADTKVDLKVLSQRLGLGKAGLRMAPEEALPEILQVPLGCVTPFALVNDSARNVSLMLDKGFKDQECCFFHPLSNDTSIYILVMPKSKKGFDPTWEHCTKCTEEKKGRLQVKCKYCGNKYWGALKAHGLDKFLKSIGKDPAYVDLEANPSVGKDQPPDLAALVPSDAILLPEEPPKAAPLQAPEKNHVPVNIKSTAVTAKAAKPSNDAQKDKSTKANLSRSFTDPEKFVEEILEKTSAIVLSEIKEETIKQHGEQLGALVSNSIKKHLSLDLINLATILKNTAYTEGFHAGTHHQGSRCP